MYRLPFEVTVIKDEESGDFYAVVNKGLVHSCTKFGNFVDEKFNKEITIESFEMIPISTVNNRIIVSIDVMEPIYSEPFKCEITGVHIDAVGYDPDLISAFIDQTKKEIKIAKINFVDGVATVEQIVQSDIWVIHSLFPNDGDSSSSSDSDSESSDQSSESDSDDSSDSSDGSDYDSSYYDSSEYNESSDSSA